MKPHFCQICSVALFVAALVAYDPIWAAEPEKFPTFHRVLVLNDTPSEVTIRTDSGLLTATCEMKHPDGNWRTIAKLEAPVAVRTGMSLCAGEAWQFIVPDFGGASPTKVRVAVQSDGGIFYSQPFDACVGRLSPNQTIGCWLARLRIMPPRSEDGSMIAAVGRESRN